MYTIKDSVNSEIIIKNSRFITILRKIEKKDDIDSILNEIKNTYKKATHYCYGYILNDIQKSSDDNEPSNTAGVPILNVLQKQDLNHILAVVVRYFGGIKLGVGGLSRAYSKSVIEAIKKTSLLKLEKAKYIKIEIDYNMQQRLDYLLESSKIVKKEFNDKVIYYAYVKEKDIQKLDKYTYTILKDTTIEA